MNQTGCHISVKRSSYEIRCARFSEWCTHVLRFIVPRLCSPLEKTHALRSGLPKICNESGYGYYDWADIVDDFLKLEKSIFSRFALCADHCHLSPLGNRLMAKKLLKTIKYKWQGKI
jgi:hypothetical protein